MNARHCIPPLVAAACFVWPLWAHEQGSADDGDDGDDGCCKKHIGEMRDGPPPKEGPDQSGGPRGPSHEELLRLIERFDTDHDGKLSDEEKSKLLAFMKLRRDGDGPQDRKGEGDGEGRPERKGDGGDCDREHPDKEGPKGPPRFKPGGPDGFKGPQDHFRSGPDKPKGPPPRGKDCCCDHEDGDGGPKGRMGGDSGPKGRKGGDDGESGDDSGSNGNDSGPRGRKGGPKGNNGVGNGEDPQPPGNPPVNDGPGSGPGKPGNRGHGRK
jgi:hypothetical protein